MIYMNFARWLPVRTGIKKTKAWSRACCPVPRSAAFALPNPCMNRDNAEAHAKCIDTPDDNRAASRLRDCRDMSVQKTEASTVAQV